MSAALGLRHVVEMSADAGNGATPFFLVAGMFGNILNLRHLAMLIGDDRAVYGIQALGLREGEEPHRRFEDMAEAYIDEIRQVQPHGPYLLGGFSRRWRDGLRDGPSARGGRRGRRRRGHAGLAAARASGAR